MFRRIFMVLLILVSVPSQSLAFSTVLNFERAAKLLYSANKVVDADLVKFAQALKTIPFSKLSVAFSHLPRAERASAMISLAVEKKLMSDADALYSLRQLKSLEQRAEFLYAKGATDNIRKLDDFHSHLLTKIAAGEKFPEGLIARQVQQVKNGGLAGTQHAKTGVFFDSEGFPIFESYFTATLPQSLNKMSDLDQFKHATLQLADKIKKEPQLAKLFSAENQQRIFQGYKPNGFTWHHNQKEGVLELVNTAIHQQTSHTGGRAIWGGGSANR